MGDLRMWRPLPDGGRASMVIENSYEDIRDTLEVCYERGIVPEPTLPGVRAPDTIGERRLPGKNARNQANSVAWGLSSEGKLGHGHQRATSGTALA